MALSKKQSAWLGLAVILAIAVIVLVYFADRQKPYLQPKQKSKTSSQQQTPQQLTAGGQPVPLKWQAKAKSLGYYCPSWNAAPGQIAPQICMPLDK